MAFDFKKVFSTLKKSPNMELAKVVGIDFGSASVKVVELESREGVITLTTYGELQLGPYAEAGMGSAVKLQESKRIEALVDVLRESSVTAKEAVFALSLADSFVTVMPIQANAEEDIGPRVHVESRKYIPVPLSDVTLEWSEIPTEGETPQLMREVLLVAIQNDSLSVVKSMLDAIQMASKPSEIELFSTLRAITKDDDTSLAVIDIGASISKLYISEKGFLRRIHRVHSGGTTATNAIARELGISFEEAENLKRNYTPTGEHASVIKKCIESTFERAFSEFKRVIGQYEVKSGTALPRIVLTGGVASFSGLESYANYVFDREIEIGNPFNKIAYPAFMEDTLKEIAPIFTVALGAALRNFEQG